MEIISNGELLTLASIDPNNPECIKAFDQFYSRYKNYIWNLSYKQVRNIDIYNSIEIAKAIFQNTIIDVHRNSSKFESRSNDPDIDIKKWLSGIVKNKVLQYIDENNKHKKHIVYLEILPDFEEEETNDNNEMIVESFEKDLLEKALKTLNAKERSILLTWFQFSINGKTQSIGKEIKENLSKQFNLRPDSLKQIKKRALQKVKDYIQQYKDK